MEVKKCTGMEYTYARQFYHVTYRHNCHADTFLEYRSISNIRNRIDIIPNNKTYKSQVLELWKSNNYLLEIIILKNKT